MENSSEKSGFSAENPIQYSVGEVCKCYFTEIAKNPDARVSQQINKCQSYCRIVEKNPNLTKEYTVTLFDGRNTTKQLPGRCLRKVRPVPFTHEQASSRIGEVIESNDVYDGHRITMVISVVDSNSKGEDVEINSIGIEEMMHRFHFRDTGAPVCNLVMLNADEAFGNAGDE